MTSPKTLLVAMPFTWGSISAKVFTSFLDMISPEIQEKLAEQNIKLKILIHKTFPIDLNRNEIVDLAVSNKYSADYLMFCDGDQVFKKDTLTRLLASLEDDVDGVTGIYFRKSPPHRCVVGKYSPWSEHLENKRTSLESQGFIAEDGQQTLYYKPLLYFDVVQRVHAFGMGCILLKTEFFKNLERPYFKYVNGHSTGGDFTYLGHSEDMWFCSQLYKKGVKILCDPKVQVGHVTEKVIFGNEAEE